MKPRPAYIRPISSLANDWPLPAAVVDIDEMAVCFVVTHSIPHKKAMNNTSEPMSDPRRHHYNPAFYLRQWAGPDGQLCEFKKIYGKLVAQPKHPNATGFMRDLYRTDGVPEEYAQHVEKNFMSPLDSGAADALVKILSGERAPWTEDERTAWTTFILSLLFRNPENVNVIKEHITTMWQEGMKALQADYAARRRPDDPETFEGYVALTNPAAPQIGASNFLMETISNERLGPTIFNMHWTRHDLAGSRIKLLTSDRPIHMPFGLGDRRAYIALPVSPTVLFLAAHDDDLARSIARQKQTGIAKLLNKVIVSQARQYVWAADSSQLEFVRRHLSTAPDRPVITEEQKQEAIAAARGQRESVAD
jgi:hypothetical protein